MSGVTVIGQAMHIRGRIAGEGALEIEGRVEGEIEVTETLSVQATGLVAANLTARSIVVRGAVRGDLSASEAISLEAGARLVGDVRAPRISIVKGALVRGHVTTSGGKSAGRRAAAPPAMAANRLERRDVREAPRPPADRPIAKTVERAVDAPRPKGAPPPMVIATKKKIKATVKKRSA